MPARGGEPRRLTFLGASLASTIGWSEDGSEIYFVAQSDDVVRRRNAPVRRFTRRRPAARAQPRARPRALVRAAAAGWPSAATPPIRRAGSATAAARRARSGSMRPERGTFT